MKRLIVGLIAIATRSSRSHAWPGADGLPLGLSSVQIEQGGMQRRYLAYVPTTYRPEDNVPLWILAHGSDDSPEIFLSMSNMQRMAETHNFAFAALEGVNGDFNVGRNANAENPYGPDDVGYTMAVMQQVTKKLNVDMQRIRCAGFSRGARFCSRLASELSNFITGLAVVSGVRYPVPNNATRAMPVIAFHGTMDAVNPYHGQGPEYWGTSVDDAVQRWATFNGCKSQRWKRLGSQVLESRHSECRDNADVKLVLIEGGGHTWPGSMYNFADLGYVTHEIAAEKVMHDFFVARPLEPRCHTAVEGESCYVAVTWAMKIGIVQRPDWYQGLTKDSSFEDFQMHMRKTIAADCADPCPPVASVANVI